MPRMLRYEEALSAQLQAHAHPFGSQSLQLGSPQTLGQERGAPSTIVEKRPWIDKPASGIEFEAQNTVQVVIPAIGAEVTVVSVVVPEGKNGVIKRLANQAVTGGWTAGTGDLVWRLEADGLAIRNFESIIASLGSLPAPRDFHQGGIRVFENQRIALILRNVSLVTGGADPVLGLLGGWFYPLEQEGESSWF